MTTTTTTTTTMTTRMPFEDALRIPVSWWLYEVSGGSYVGSTLSPFGRGTANEISVPV